MKKFILSTPGILAFAAFVTAAVLVTMLFYVPMVRGQEIATQTLSEVTLGEETLSGTATDFSAANVVDELASMIGLTTVTAQEIATQTLSAFTMDGSMVAATDLYAATTVDQTASSKTAYAFQNINATVDEGISMSASNAADTSTTALTSSSAASAGTANRDINWPVVNAFAALTCSLGIASWATTKRGKKQLSGIIVTGMQYVHGLKDTLFGTITQFRLVIATARDMCVSTMMSYLPHYLNTMPVDLTGLAQTQHRLLSFLRQPASPSSARASPPINTRTSVFAAA